MRLTEFVVRDAIVADLKADSKEAAIRRMVSSLKDAGKVRAGDAEAIIAAILKREELGSTGIDLRTWCDGGRRTLRRRTRRSMENILRIHLQSR